MYPKYMMATTAIHKLGDISSDVPDICVVHGDDGDDYIGNWVCGIGYFGVKFPKTSTRDLTPEEIQRYNGQHIRMYGCHTGKDSGVSWTLQIKDQ